MINDEGQMVDIYIPRKCSYSNRLIEAKDHSSVQLNIAHIDENGVYTGQFTTMALCGYLRNKGQADSALDNLWKQKKAEVGQN
ncbi:ribosomal protein S21 [Pseudoscourfieldia marina]